jgi:hypothetical protein
MLAKHWDEGNQDWLETMAERGDVQRRTFESEEYEANWVVERIL